MTKLFTKEHEWLQLDGDEATVGITAYAAEQLGDVVYVELPDVGRQVTAEGDMAVVESAKAASDVYAPASGEVTAVNDALSGAPEKVNEDPEGKGWFVKLKLSDKSQLDALMDEAAYKAFLKDLG
jgi:glycine cleavage system H protein